MNSSFGAPNLFYMVGGGFAIATIIYFTAQYAFLLSENVKLALLMLLTVAFFFGARALEKRGI
jgi:hypothetical protein